MRMPPAEGTALDRTTTWRPSGHRMPDPGGGRLAVVRDVVIVAVCLALVVNFLTQLWNARARASHDLRPAPVTSTTTGK